MVYLVKIISLIGTLMSLYIIFGYNITTRCFFESPFRFTECINCILSYALVDKILMAIEILRFVIVCEGGVVSFIYF